MKSQVGVLEGAEVLYPAFTCEGCGCQGELRVPAEMGSRVSCPEGCGAGYVLHRGVGGDLTLTCVVAPVFEDEEEDDDEYDDDDLDEDLADEYEDDEDG